MFSTPPDPRTAPSVVAAAAAAAMAQVHDRILELEANRGRAGVVARLRERAEDFASSGIARRQVKAQALSVAADDLAADRAILADWPTFFSASLRPDPGRRAEIRRLIGDYEPPVAVATSVAASIETLLLREGPDASAASRRLRDEIMLQAAMWDDPRIMATLEARRLMRAGELGLGRRLEKIERDRIAVKPPASSTGGVGRWLRTLVEPWAPRP